jgi:hypothetical protein
MVTTSFAQTLITGVPSSAATMIQIGGTVTDSHVPPRPPANVWVELLTPVNVRVQLGQTDVQGHFTFLRVPAGPWQLRASTPGFAVVTRNITVPSPTGEYDLQL